MKNPIQKLLKSLSVGACLGFSLAPHLAQAGIQYWDNNGTATPSSGVWDGSTAEWSSSSNLTSSMAAWGNNNLAVFTAGGVSPGNVTVTVNAAIGFGGIDNNGVSGPACNLTVTNGASGSLTLATGTQGFYTSSGYSTTYVMPIGGPGSLQPQGAGSMYLYAPMTFTGGLSFDQTGIVYITNGSAFGTGPFSLAKSGGAVVVNNGYQVTVTNTFSGGSFNENFVPGSGGLVFSGPWNLGTTTPTIGTGSSAGNTVTISGVISGTGSLNAYNAGTLILTGVNTYTGSTSNSCPLVISGAGQLNSGSYAGKWTNSSSITYNSTAPQTLSGVISGTGSLIQKGSGALTLSAANTFSGGTSISNGATLTIGGGGTLASAGNLTNNGSFVYNSTAGQTISGIISGSGTITEQGTGQLTLSGANTFTGLFTVNGGLLAISADNNLGTAPSSVVSNAITLSGGTNGNYGLRVQGSSVTLNANRGILLGASGGAIQVAGNDTCTYNGVISGNGGLETGTSDTVGYGTLILGGSNTYAGATTIAAGTLRLGINGALPSGTPLAVASDQSVGAVFDLNGHTQTVGPLSSSTGVGGTGTKTPTVVLSGELIVLETNDTAFNGVLSGAGGSLVLEGTNKLTLGGTNTFSGSVNLTSGTLLLNSNAYLAQISALQIAAGATFDVSSNAAYACGTNVTITAGGAATPAIINGALGGTINLGSQPIVLNYDGTDPALTIAQGTLVLGTNTFTVNGAPLAVGTYTLIQQANGNITATGPFTVAGSAIGAGTTGSVSVNAGNVILTVIPVPTFSNLIASQDINYGTNAITLSGTLSVGGTLYPAQGDTVTVTIDGNAQATTIADATGDFSLTYNPSSLPARGTAYTITYAYAGNGQLGAASDASTALTVNPAPLTVTAGSGSKLYGQTVLFGAGSANFTSSGLQNGETIGSVTLVDGGNGGAANAPVAGSPYAITATAATGGTFNPANYTITYAPGALVVSPAPLSVTAVNQTSTYGQAVTFGGGSTGFTSSGLQNGETIGSLTLTASGNGGAANAPVSGSPYTITPSAATGGTFDPNNYAITYNPGALTVNAAALTVSAANQTKTYGQVVTFGSGNTNFTSVGLQNGETIGSVTLTDNNSGGVSNAPVSGSPYTLMASAAAGGTFNPANYSITYGSGTLTVNPAALSITAANQTKAFGTALTVGSGNTNFVSSGLQNAETIGSVTLAVSGGGDAATASVSGSPYTLTASAAAGGTFNPANYSITYNPGALTITSAALTISANNQSKTYGQALTLGSGSTNFTATGLQNGDTVGSVTLAVNGGDVANAPVSGSPYTITPSAATGGTFDPNNYAITYAAGTLTISPATLTVSADNFSRIYGAANPVFTVTYTNFANGETLATSDVVGSPVLNTAADTNSDVGAYVITNSIGTLGSSNYTFNLVNGTLTVTNAYSTNVLTASTNPALPGTAVVFTATLSTLSPSAAVPTNLVQFLIDGTNYNLTAYPTNGLAIITNSSLSHGYHVIEADYAGDTNAAGETNIIGSTNTVSELINTPPVAGPAAYSRLLNTVLQIPISNLLTNATDADGDALTLVAVSALSTNGATVITNSANVTYTAPATNGNVTDAFTYVVQDAFGATNAGTVTVTIQSETNGPPVNITGLSLQANGTVAINFSGVPNYTYLIESTTSLNPPITWTVVGTNMADTNGLFQFTDMNATNHTIQYYRTSTP